MMKRILLAAFLTMTMAPAAFATCATINGSFYCGSSSAYKANLECRKETGNNSGHNCDDDIDVCKCNTAQTIGQPTINLDGYKPSKKIQDLVREYDLERRL